MKLKKILRIILPIIVIAYLAGIIFIATSSKLPNVDHLPQADKLIHLIEFFIFSLLLLATLIVYEFNDYYLIGFGFVLLLIIASEMVQIPLHNRTFSVQDIMADLVGVGLGFACMYGVNRKWNLLKRLF